MANHNRNRSRLNVDVAPENTTVGILRHLVTQADPTNAERYNHMKKAKLIEAICRLRRTIHIPLDEVLLPGLRDWLCEKDPARAAEFQTMRKEQIVLEVEKLEMALVVYQPIENGGGAGMVGDGALVVADRAMILAHRLDEWDIDAQGMGEVMLPEDLRILLLWGEEEQED
ncbi:hypothetical protein BU26DRAFT_500204 [Trematosphaeria pertusa]|uniref:Uncharacterized protein n=1 Tax=Trematosphaeria pertusa TaxID=390896 RepID=A0A6A6IVL0_9PLEO|nr:uncharacterized protein BU26DRAFT_500204 [Trematosphaeria pertusa]KAF2254454.1 hypothetical protein BU26DRAFT_500204 [Trematosphaeria pertusa]